MVVNIILYNSNYSVSDVHHIVNCCVKLHYCGNNCVTEDACSPGMHNVLLCDDMWI